MSEVFNKAGSEPLAVGVQFPAEIAAALPLATPSDGASFLLKVRIAVYRRK